MRVNEYQNLNEFIYEYDSGRRSSNETHKRKFMGIEFLYNNVYYRMCREPLDEKNNAVYQVSVMHCEKVGYPVAENFELIGSYEDIYDLLENCIIDNKKFELVIMDDKTKILSQD